MVLPVLALGWLFAMAAVGVWDVPFWLPSLTIGLLAPAAAAWMAPRWGLLVLAVALLALAGGARFDAWRGQGPPPLAPFLGAAVRIEGEIASAPDPGLTTNAYRFEAAHVTVGAEQHVIEGAVLVQLSQFSRFLPGDRLVLSGKMEAAPVFEDFDYRGYLARQGIAGIMYLPRVEVLDSDPGSSLPRTLARARLELDASLQRALPEPEASLAAGIAFGRDGGMSRELYDDFRDTGLAHIVAVSGSNVALVTALTFLVLVPYVGRRWASVPAMAAILSYVLIVGYEPSVVRSGVMAAIFIAGAMLGRQQAGLAALGAAGIVMTALDPGAAASLGFQLSFAATAGLMVFGPWLRYGLEVAIQRARLGPIVPGIMVLAVAYSTAATIATLPLIWVSFGRVSLVGPIANVIIEPLWFGVFWMSMATAAAGLISERAAWAVGLLAYYPLGLTVWLARTLAGLPGAAIDVPRLGGTWAMLAYLVLGAAGWPAYRYLAPSAPRSARGPGWLRPVAFSAVTGGVAVAVVIVSLLPLRGPGELVVATLDVGQGDAILITTPGGERLLVDGGPSGIELARELGETMPHWARDIDAVFLTHPQQDHLGGLPGLFERFDVEHVYESRAANTTEAYAAYQERAPGRVTLVAGESLSFDGVRIDVLWPPAGYASSSLNNHSLVLRLTYGETTILLAGDIEGSPQRELLATTDVATNVIKVPHHGSATSDPGFLAAAAGEIAIISVGEGNPFGHPRDEVLSALAGVSVLRTDLHGRVTVRSDGARVRVTVERGP